MAGKNNRAFLLIAYYLHCKTVDDFRDFVAKFERYDMKETQWAKQRRTIRKYLLSSWFYWNDCINGEIELFQWHFRTEEFAQLLRSEQKLHTLRQCKKCQSEVHRVFYLLCRRNKALPRDVNDPSAQVVDPKKIATLAVVKILILNRKHR